MPDINNKCNVQKDNSKVRHSLLPDFITLSIISCIFLLLFGTAASGSEIAGPEVRIRGNEILVTTALSLDEKHIQELRNGVTKEFRFHVDLFRVWNVWPDEFIVDKFYVRTLKSDPVKKEYVATSGDGSTLIQKRFKSLESMLSWALTVNDLKLANMKELEPSSYFVRVTVESRIRKLPPVLGYFMIFLPENEFKISKDSPPVSVGILR